jgi:hypothetical protein
MPGSSRDDNAKTNYIQPVITLMLITPFLTEVLTTNVSISTMLHPKVLLAMMTVGYGFAVFGVARSRDPDESRRG